MFWKALQIERWFDALFKDTWVTLGMPEACAGYAEMQEFAGEL